MGEMVICVCPVAMHGYSTSPLPLVHNARTTTNNNSNNLITTRIATRTTSIHDEEMTKPLGLGSPPSRLQQSRKTTPRPGWSWLGSNELQPPNGPLGSSVSQQQQQQHETRDPYWGSAWIYEPQNATPRPRESRLCSIRASIQPSNINQPNPTMNPKPNRPNPDTKTYLYKKSLKELVVLNPNTW